MEVTERRASSLGRRRPERGGERPPAPGTGRVDLVGDDMRPSASTTSRTDETKRQRPSWDGNRTLSAHPPLPSGFCVAKFSEVATELVQRIAESAR